MALLNYMQRNKFGVYEYKRRIPKDLPEKLPEYNTGLIKFSLKTKDANEAKRLKQQQDAIHEAMFDEARGVQQIMPDSNNVRAVSAVSSVKPVTLPRTGKFLVSLVSLWQQEGDKTPKTLDSMNRMVAKFEEQHGRIDIAHITRAHVIVFSPTKLWYIIYRT